MTSARARGSEIPRRVLSVAPFLHSDWRSGGKGRTAPGPYSGLGGPGKDLDGSCQGLIKSEFYRCWSGTKILLFPHDPAPYPGTSRLLSP